MAEKRFSKQEAIKFGWEAMKNNLLFFIVFLIVVWIISGATSFLGSPTWGPHMIAFPIVFSILGWIVSIFIAIAETKIALRLSAASGVTAEIEDVWSGYRFFLDLLIGSILYGLLVFVGILLLIVPGIYWGIKYSMFGYLIIDKEMPPVAALKESGRITMGAKWDLFLLGLLFFGITILGILACVVGLFAAIPTIMVAHAFVYRRLAYGEVVEQAPAATQPQQEPQLPQPPGS